MSKIIQQKKYFKLILATFSTLFLNINYLAFGEEILPVNSEIIDSIDKKTDFIRNELKKVYQLDLTSTDVILNPRIISFNSEQSIDGYARILKNIKPESIKMAARADLNRNYTGFTEGWLYQLNEKELVLKASDKIIDKTDLEEKTLTDNVFLLTKKITLSDKQQKRISVLPYLVSIGEAEIKNGDILEAYSQAKNIAITNGLKFYYQDKLKTQKSGKIFLQNILYNSFDSENLNLLTKFTYIIQFAIKDDKK